MDEIYANGMESWLNSVNLHNAFVLKDRHVRCIDERTPGGVHLAGAGILLTAEEAAEITKLADADGIYSHDDCGAADIAGKDPLEFAKAVSARAGVPYLGHIPVSGPHIARVAYVDGTGRFSQIPELPPGFNMSWRYTQTVNKEYARQEAVISAQIALGNHGFGDMFTKYEPFVIVPIGDPYDKRFSLDTITDALKDIPKDFNGRVKIDGFTAPEYK